MRFGLILSVLFLSGQFLGLHAQPLAQSRLVGRVLDPGGAPAAGVIVVIEDREARVVSSLSSDQRGAFEVRDLPAGTYRIVYGFAGDVATAEISETGPEVDVGTLAISEDATVMLDALKISADREAFYNSIDRKTYDVGKDIASTTGSAGDLLQNIPSVQVDVEGEVSLRGDQNVTILINGRSSAQMNNNQAEALEQLSADRIARVEVVTNPSSRYRPDGTGGIINIILKDAGDPGWSSTVRANVGNEGRYNASLHGSYNPGRYDAFASLSRRREERPFHVERERLQRDAGGQVAGRSTSRSEESRRFDSTNVETGVTYRFNEYTELVAGLGYGVRDRDQQSFQTTWNRDTAGVSSGEYDRISNGDEREEEYEAELAFHHDFDGRGRKLAVDFGHESETEKGSDYYLNRYRLPTLPDERERTAQTEKGRSTELKVDYVHPLANGTKVESGYALLVDKNDLDVQGSLFDSATQDWRSDLRTTNHFIYESQVHAVYATYAAALGDWGLQGGLRFEQAYTDANQVTAGIATERDYARVYPSVHASYDLTATQQLKFSYSHRVRRPNQWHLNPYPRYNDPQNLRAGNPDLSPENIHSIEAGWQYRAEGITYLASVYQRYRYDGITQVTRPIENDVWLTTFENLATSRFTGVELGATARWGKTLSLNFGGNIYREEIESEGPISSEERHTIAWDAKLNVAWEVNQKLSLQLTSGYRARRLTPQGERRPMAISNLGARYRLTPRTALVLTVSDVFRTFESRTVLDTPSLYSDTRMDRGSSVVYFGVIHQLGRSSRRGGDDLQFDESLGDG